MNSMSDRKIFTVLGAALLEGAVRALGLAEPVLLRAGRFRENFVKGLNFPARAGMSPGFADAVLETARSFNEGEPWGLQPRTVYNITPTTLADWARQPFAEGAAR